MESVLIAALMAATTAAATASGAGPAPTDLGCFRLMAELADDENPRTRAAARIAAQYFLGRIDASGGRLHSRPARATPLPAPQRAALLRQCADVLDASGHDFRAIGDLLIAGASPDA